MIKVGKEAALGVIDLKILLGLSSVSERELLQRLLSCGVCYRISDMKINGNDVAAAGIKGKAIGQTLEKMLFEIAEGKLSNDREVLISALARFI